MTRRPTTSAAVLARLSIGAATSNEIIAATGLGRNMVHSALKYLSKIGHVHRKRQVVNGFSCYQYSLEPMP